MDLYEFENIVKKLDKNKYHINRTLGFNNDGKMYLEKWSIFRKDMTTEEYFSPENLVVLSSEHNNTIEDIEKLNKSGVEGIVIGSALYTNKIDLTEALKYQKR